MAVLILINASVLIMLSFLHVYWAMGGNRGMSGVLPEFSERQRRFSPGVAGKFIIGFAMGLFTLITIGNLDIFRAYINIRFFNYATLCTGFIFLLRAIGDFHYVGLFKKANGTLFAKNDTRYYIPACLFIACTSFIIGITALWR